MSALIWMLTWLPHVLPAMSELPQPVDVTLTSKHFNHTLYWEAGPGTPTGVYYQVSWHTDSGLSWMPAVGCEQVMHRLECNLTEALSIRNQRYYIQVTALREGQASQPSYPHDLNGGFLPIRDTHLDLPWLNVTSCGRNLCVDPQPPVELLRDVYESLRYKLRIQFDGGDREQDTMFLRKEILENLAPSRQHCISIRFSDTLTPRWSNYSHPVCVSTKGSFAADPLISTVLCVLVLLGLAVVFLLVHAGYICLTGRQLPLVLTSIRHLEGVLVVTPSRASFSSLSNLKPTLPSSGGKRSSQTSSDDSDDESETEASAGSSGGTYKMRVGTDQLSSSSSSSSSLSAPLCPQAEPQTLPETHSGAEHTLSARTDSQSGQCASDSPADSLTGRIPPKQEEEEDSQDVNLLSLTFGRQEEGEEEEEKVHVEPSSASVVCNTTTDLLAHTWDSKDAAAETVSCSEQDEEEEEEEDSEYIRR